MTDTEAEFDVDLPQHFWHGKLQLQVSQIWLQELNHSVGKERRLKIEKNENKTLGDHRIKEKLILEKGLKIKSVQGILLLCNTPWL